MKRLIWLSSLLMQIWISSAGLAASLKTLLEEAAQERQEFSPEEQLEKDKEILREKFRPLQPYSKIELNDMQPVTAISLPEKPRLWWQWKKKWWQLGRIKGEVGVLITCKNPPGELILMFRFQSASLLQEAFSDFDSSVVPSILEMGFSVDISIWKEDPRPLLGATTRINDDF